MTITSAPIALIMSSGDFGGMEKVVFSLAQAFQDNNVDVIVYVILECRAGHTRLNRLHSFLDTFPQTIKRRIFETRNRYDKALLQHLLESLSEDGVQLVHCHCYKSAFYVTRMKSNNQLKDIPVAFTIHGLFLEKTLGSIAVLMGYYVSLAKVDGIIVCASHLQSHLKWWPRLLKKSCVIQNALPPLTTTIPRPSAREKLASDYQLENDAFWIANIGRLAPEKNFKLFIDISQEVQRQFKAKVQYLVIGDGPLQNSLQEYAKTLPTGKDIVFTGFIDNMATVYAAIDVFMMTSNTEGTSMSLLEAMRAKLPIIATEVGGNSVVIQTGRNGILFPAGDTYKGSAALIDLLKNMQHRKALGLNAYNTWSNEYATASWVAKHKVLYDSLLQKA